MARTPEGKIKDRVKAAIKKYGGYQFWPVQSGYGASTLDCFACIYGSWFVIETKAPGGKLTPRQVTTVEAMRAAGALVLVINSEERAAKFEAICKKLHDAYMAANAAERINEGLQDAVSRASSGFTGD